MGMRIQTRKRGPAVDWHELTSHIDTPTLRRIIVAADKQHFDLTRMRWTVASLPALAAHWDREGNGALQPREIAVASNKAVRWRCPAAADHVWEQAPSMRLVRDAEGQYRVTGCPFCSHHRTTPRDSLAGKDPKLARQWHPTRNGKLRPTDVAPQSHKIAWWKCEKGHQWKESVAIRTATGGKCPYCFGHRLTRENSLAVRAPDLAAQWHPTKNGALRPQDILANSARSVWWKCPEAPDHEWQRSPSYRNSARNCPFCLNRMAADDNSLAVQHPELARQWHPQRNGSLKPRDVVSSSAKKVWWKCPKGADHEWCCRVLNRAQNHTGCPFCSGRFVSKTTSLAAVYPAIAKQWHPKRNGTLKPSQVTTSSGRKIWWKCTKGPDHEWCCTVSQRVHCKSGCPFCAGRRVSKASLRR